MKNAALASLTYEQAENHYHAGYITQAQWEAYVTGWRRSAPRLSSLGAGAEGSQSPEVEAIVAEIDAAAKASAA